MSTLLSESAPSSRSSLLQRNRLYALALAALAQGRETMAPAALP